MHHAFAYQLLVNAQPSAPGQLPPSLYPEQDAMGMEHLSAQLGAAVPLSNSMCPLCLIAGRAG